MDTFRSIIVLLLVVFFSHVVIPNALAARKLDIDSQGQKDSSTYQSQENNPRAVIKEGLFVGFDKERVSILTGKTSKKKEYRLTEDYRVIYNEQEIDWNEIGIKQIPPHSIVKLVMIDGQVVEIILVEVSS